MKAIFNKVLGSIKKYKINNQNEKVKRFVTDYVSRYKLIDLINGADEHSTSTGAELSDYVALHSYILKYKPKFILECGTGKSTWILAHAMNEVFKQTGHKGLIVSMESIEKWHKEAGEIFPEQFKEYVQLHHSPASTFMYSFIKGTCFTEIPEYPYDLVFVDGPELTITENGNSYETCNMDFIRYLLTTNKKATAIIDSRLRTSIAYGIIFGKEKVQFIKPWNLGIVENVDKSDMLLNVDGISIAKIRSQATSFSFSNPKWIDELR
jgi:hypothetical protein